MGRHELEELRRRKKDQIVKLVEISDVTQQIADAAERNDAVAAQLLLGEREQPVRELHEMEENIRACLLELPEEQAIHLNELLHGEGAQTPEEQALAEQAAQFQRMLEALIKLDRQLSIRLGGNRSIYKKFRE